MDNALKSIIEELASIQRRYSHIHTSFERIEQKMSCMEQEVGRLENRTALLALPDQDSQSVQQV